MYPEKIYSQLAILSLARVKVLADRLWNFYCVRFSVV